MSIPLSTYRFQLNSSFPFEKVEVLVSYLKSLGVDTVYLSPILLARPGSTHGYDICDHTKINPELGGLPAFEKLSEKLRDAGIGCLIDYVPNHMGAEPASNPWWWDVLENGPSSPFSTFFDIDWAPVKPELKGKVLLPVLGDQYGIILEKGELKLGVKNGALILNYWDKTFPINPRMMGMVFHPTEGERLPINDPESNAEFLSILTSLRNLPVYLETDSVKIEERQREKEIAKKRLLHLLSQDNDVLHFVEKCIEEINGVPGNPASFDRLHELLENQPYRLSYWRTAGQEINYRRFFDINDLLGVRMENPIVTGKTHEFLMSLVADGHVSGIRLDHIDGLYDPEQYLFRLGQMLKEATLVGDNPSNPIYVVVEKILCGSEELPGSWAVHGTTGYEFLNDVNGLFIDSKGVKLLTKLNAIFTKDYHDFEEETRRCKRLILDTSMASELNVLANILNRMSEADRRCRDFTLDSLRNVLREIIVCMRVYRTYIRPEKQSTIDREAILDALENADRLNPATEPSIFQFLKVVLLPFEPCSPNTPGMSLSLEERFDFAMKFQQLSGPVQARGVEDTAFYRHTTLLSLNDVGGEPNSFGVTISDFHSRNAKRLKNFPFSMITTATHDTKRGEDARARISTLSWNVALWRKTVGKLSRIAQSLRKQTGEGAAPSRQDEYFVYQTLVGCWPILENGSAAPADHVLLDRLKVYFIKAIREAKQRTSWINPDQTYEDGMLKFVESLIMGRNQVAFQKAFFPFIEAIAKQGAFNSLIQLSLKCSCPGVPDIYQGTEYWDLSLVDPDNRRSVDFESRQLSLAEMEDYIHPLNTIVDRALFVQKLIGQWPTAKIKQYIMGRSLRWRKEHADLFMKGDYEPMTIRGHQDAMLCFSRILDERKLIVCALVRPYLTETPLQLSIPDEWGALEYTDIYTNSTYKRECDSQGAYILLAGAFSLLPVVWLWSIPNS